MAGQNEVDLRRVVAMCSLALQQITVPEGSAEQTEFCRLSGPVLKWRLS